MSEHLFPFEKLRVWQSAREFVKGIYGLTKNFPASELYGLTSQINRASISVAANLAEGASRTSAKDQAHFSQLAYSSLMETACLLILSADIGIIAASAEQDLRRQIESISAQINALRNAQLAR